MSSMRYIFFGTNHLPLDQDKTLSLGQKVIILRRVEESLTSCKDKSIFRRVSSEDLLRQTEHTPWRDYLHKVTKAIVTVPTK
jgi:hypothetical protein